MPETLHRTPIAIVDEDGSALSARIGSAFIRAGLHAAGADLQCRGRSDARCRTLHAGAGDTARFPARLLAGRAPALQLNVDATRMSQAFGSGFAQQVVQGEVMEFLRRERGVEPAPVELVTRVRFNPTGSNVWFGSLMELVNLVTMLSIILTGAALIREREHGTVEHLLVMPVTPTEIMLAKVWAMGLVVTWYRLACRCTA